VKPIYLTGVGLFSPGFADVTSWREGRPDAAVDKPPCKLVNARLGRGSSRFAGMLGEVVEQAAEEGGVDAHTVPTVYGSSLGEIETMVTLLRMLYEEEGKLSPNRFKNSVHNAASGLVSIGTGNTAFSTAIAGGDRSFEMSLLEAWALLDDARDRALPEADQHVILAVADDAPPSPLDRLGAHGALAVGLCLSAHPPSRPGLRLSELRSGDLRSGDLRSGDLRSGDLRSGDLRSGGEPLTAPRVPEELRANCASAGLGLVEAFLARRRGAVSVAPSGQAGMVVDVTPV
jgi:hypothetical protein